MGHDRLNVTYLEQAASARILVAITVHFNANRLEYLAEVLRSLGEFPVPVMDIILVTNTVDDEELTLLQRLCDEILPGKSASIRSYEYLAHPHYLTWRHREIVASEFAGARTGRYTHFIYLEDDIRISFLNFSYFVEYREILRDAGLIPSFLRVEYNRFLNGFVDSDNKAQIDVSAQPKLDLGETVMVSLPNPYIAFYILDTDLAAEFLRSRSFRRERSRSVPEMTDMDVRERAAMGVSYENVPEPFACRYVVPVSKSKGLAWNSCWVSHLPNNYANDPKSGFGKIRMDCLFLNARDEAMPDRGETLDGMAQARVSAARGKVKHTLRNGFERYFVLPNKIIEGLRWRLGGRR